MHGAPGVTKPLPNATSWRRNLAVLWVAQAVTTLGFTFTFPFFPLFFQSLGVTDPRDAAFMTGVSGWALGLGLAIGSPIWGVVGDRFGRRRNVIRAMLMGGVVFGLTGFVQTTLQLVLSRFFAGALVGVTAAILAMAAATTPRHMLAFALGLLQSSMAVGITLGPVLGGILFDRFGLRVAFFANGAVVGAAALLVWLFTREHFAPPTAPLRSPFAPFRDMWRMTTSRELLPLMLMLLLTGASGLVVFPALAVIVKVATPGGNAATAAGVLFMVFGICQTISALTMGWLGSRYGLRRVFPVACAGAAIVYIGPYLAAGSISALTLLLALAALFQGGLQGAVNGLMAMTTAPERQGALFGAAQAVNAIAIAFGPLLGGVAAQWWGLRSVFWVAVVMYGVTAVLAGLLLRSRQPAAHAGATGA